MDTRKPHNSLNWRLTVGLAAILPNADPNETTKELRARNEQPASCDNGQGDQTRLDARRGEWRPSCSTPLGLVSPPVRSSF